MLAVVSHIQYETAFVSVRSEIVEAFTTYVWFNTTSQLTPVRPPDFQLLVYAVDHEHPPSLF